MHKEPLNYETLRNSFDKVPRSLALITREQGLTPVLNSKSSRQEEEGFTTKGSAKFQNKSFCPFCFFIGIFLKKNLSFL